MFAMRRENHGGTAARGICGVGKCGLVVVSQKQDVRVFTRAADREYWCAEVPWRRMFETGRYAGMIRIREMTGDVLRHDPRVSDQRRSRARSLKYEFLRLS
jgi:hypothetical protein